MKWIFLIACFSELAFSFSAVAAQRHMIQGSGKFERKEIAERVANAKAHRQSAAWCQEHYNTSRYKVLDDGFYRCNLHPETKEYHCTQKLQIECQVP